MATELGQAYIQIMPSARGMAKALKEELDMEIPEAGKSAGSSLASTLIKTVTGIISAAAIGKAISASLTEGGDLQQSLGGIETLFKDSADKVKAYANEAYRTAGLSANDYMETVTSFSASLLQSMGGDTEKAGEKANMALIDMSDNANKMGTDMESISNAYKGFAKQNYTMLDNLALGYGGTKSEMERLLKDATKLTGVKYNIDNLADVYDAIHAIQVELGITGTTALEAAETLSGSFAAMQGAFKNVLGNLAIGEELTPHLEALAETVSTFLFGNFIPMLTNIFKALPSAITTFLQSAIPYFIEGGQNLINSLGDGMTLSIPALITSALGLISNLVEAFQNNLGSIVDTGLAIIKNLLQGVMDSLPVLIQEVPRIINNFADAIYSQMPKILKSGVEIIVILIKGIISAIPTLVANMPAIVKAIVNVITLYNWAQLGKNVITKLGEGIKSMTSNLASTAKNLASNAINAIKTTFSDAPSVGKGLVEHLITGVKILAEALLSTVRNLARNAMDAIKLVFGDAKNIGSDMIRGVWDGIRNMGGWLTDKVGGLFSGLMSSVKSSLGIHSPSRLFRDEIGKNIALGIGVGIEKNGGGAIKSILGLASDIYDSFPLEDLISSSFGGLSLAMDSLMGANGLLRFDMADNAQGPTNNYFNIAKMEVREEADIKKIARDLYQLQESDRRGRGL